MNKMFKRLERRARRYDKTDNPDDDEAVLKLTYGMDKITNTLAGLSKTDQLEKRIEELERAAGLAQKAKPIST